MGTTKRIVAEVKKTGFESLLGEQVILFGGNYFYAGKLVSVNDEEVGIEGASLVYETGSFSDSSWKDAQKMGAGVTYVRTRWIESYRQGK